MASAKAFLLDVLIRLLSVPTRRVLRENKPVVVGITGSIGKTTAKQFIAEILSKKYSVRFAKRSLNTPIGILLTVLDEEAPYSRKALSWLSILFRAYFYRKNSFEVLVLELGADKPNDISELLSMISLDYAVITAITENHITPEQFENLDQIFAEKTKLITESGAKRAWMQASIPQCEKFASDPRVTLIREEDIGDISSGADGLRFGALGQSWALPHLYGAYLTPLIVSVISLCEELGIDNRMIQWAFSELQFPAGRGNFLDGKSESVIVDSSYNANPQAFMALIRETSGWQTDTKKILVMGSMNELGESSETYHEKVAITASESNFDEYVCIGHSANIYARVLLAAGKGASNILICDTAVEAGETYAKRLGEDEKYRGALFVVKGSQNRVWMERFIARILADSADRAKLCRNIPNA